jgi:hypothetical protein
MPVKIALGGNRIAVDAHSASQRASYPVSLQFCSSLCQFTGMMQTGHSGSVVPHAAGQLF